MRITRWAGVVLLSGYLAGCAAKTPPPAPPPPEPTPTPEMAANARQSLLAADSGARMGMVKAVLPDRNLVAVGDVPVREFSVGEVVQIVGGNMNVIAVGKVIRLEDEKGLLVVEYNSNARRMPEVGDLAVRLTDRDLPVGAHVNVPPGNYGGNSPPPVNTPAPANNPAPVNTPNNPPSEPAPVAQPATAPADISAPKPADTSAPKAADAPQPADTPKPVDVPKPADAPKTEEEKKASAEAPAGQPANAADASAPASKPSDFNK